MPPAIYIASLVAQYGIPAVVALLENLNKAVTVADAVKVLNDFKSAQDFLNEEAARRGVEPIVMPGADFKP